MSEIAADYIRNKRIWVLAEDDATEALADAEMARIEPHLSPEDELFILLEFDKLTLPCAWSMTEQ